MALGPINIPPLQEKLPIVDADRRPMASFIRSLNTAFRLIQRSFNDQADIVQQLAILAGLVDDQGNLIAAQQAEIDGLQISGAEAQKELSLINSGIINVVTPPMIEADSAGDITLSDHERRYGDPTLNPTVAVAGGLLTTGVASGTALYIYYDDTARAGGSVTYNYTTDPTDVVQSGNRHSIGSVTIPPTGTQEGIYVTPRGVT